MSKFVEELVRLSQRDKVDSFKITSIPVECDTSSYDTVGELLKGDKWLKEFVEPQVDESKAERTRYTNRVGNKRKRFMAILARNLACGIYDEDFVEKLSSIDRRVASGDLKVSENHEYYDALLNREAADRLMEAKGARVSGKNNPGYQHGGKLSPFSESFTRYAGLSTEEKRKELDDLSQRRSSTVANNPQNNPLRLEYYIERGMSEEEAAAALHDRQSTFSLGECVEKYGEEEGWQVWKDRQDGWQETLGKKDILERHRIARDKAGSVHGRLMNSGKSSDIVYIYIAFMSNDLVKIGHTCDMSRRMVEIRRAAGESNELIMVHETTLEHAYGIENTLVDSLKEYSLFMSGDKVGGYNSTEYFNSSDEFLTLLEETLELNSLTLREWDEK